MKEQWTVFLLACVYLVGELGHYLLSVLSRLMAHDLHYGEKACYPPEVLNKSNGTLNADSNASMACYKAGSKEECETYNCLWEYSGLGVDYQLLAGPSYIAVFTTSAVLWGIAADRCNRIVLVFLAGLLFSFSLLCTAFSTSFWHLILFRLLLGLGVGGCAPLAAGIIYDAFPEEKRGKAMSIFNLGMFLGYGISFSVGTYVPEIFHLGWRGTYTLCSIPALFLVTTLLCTTTDPKRRIHEEETTLLTTGCRERISPWKKCFTFPVLILMTGACTSRAAGYTLLYNSALYFDFYYPNVDVGWWQTGTYCSSGVIGSVFGGILSDVLARLWGLEARVLLLAVGQFLASPFALGYFCLDPPWAFLLQFFSYIFRAMWFGTLCTIFVELVPNNIRSTAFAMAFFLMENIGGNVPIVVEYLSKILTYRIALVVMYPGLLFASALFFSWSYFLLKASSKYSI